MTHSDEQIIIFWPGTKELSRFTSRYSLSVIQNTHASVKSLEMSKILIPSTCSHRALYVSLIDYTDRILNCRRFLKLNHWWVTLCCVLSHRQSVEPMIESTILLMNRWKYRVLEVALTDFVSLLPLHYATLLLGPIDSFIPFHCPPTTTQQMAY